MAFLAPIDAQGQFEKKGWCLGSLHGLLCLLLACDMSCEHGTRTLARLLFPLFSPASTNLFFRCRLFRSLHNVTVTRLSLLLAFCHDWAAHGAQDGKV